MRRLEAELAEAKRLAEHHRQRADIAEASSRRAWQMATWGGQRRDQAQIRGDG
jgi:hypothetical protein